MRPWTLRAGHYTEEEGWTNVWFIEKCEMFSFLGNAPWSGDEWKINKTWTVEGITMGCGKPFWFLFHLAGRSHFNSDWNLFLEAKMENYWQHEIMGNIKEKQQNKGLKPTSLVKLKLPNPRKWNNHLILSQPPKKSSVKIVYLLMALLMINILSHLLCTKSKG